MEHFLVVLVGVLVIAIVRTLIGDKDSSNEKNIKQKSIEDNNKMQITQSGVEVEIGTRDFLMRVLIEIGCQYTIDEENRICFDYQGEHLWAYADNECKFVVMYDAFWESCELFDVEKVANMKRAINNVNLNETVTVIYTINEADNTMWVHCKKNFLFIPEIQSADAYLRSIFASLFQAHHALGAELERLKKNGMPPQV